MLTLDQLTRLREVCRFASSNADYLSDFPGDVYAIEEKKAAAALADIDAEIEQNKETSNANT